MLYNVSAKIQKMYVFVKLFIKYFQNTYLFIFYL